nr:hypothetical protein [bacterium]
MKHYLRYVFFLFFLILCAPLSIAQTIYFPYYGKNKVLYEKFNWNSYKTEHFNIYYYTDSIQVLKNIAEMAESAYQRISTELKHPLPVSVPLILQKQKARF